MDEIMISGAPPKGDYDVNLKGHKAILFAVINNGNSGDNQLVAADNIGRSIKVLSYVIVANGTVGVAFRSNTTALTGAMPLVVNSGVASPMSSPAQGPLFQTNANEALNINLSTNVSVFGHLSYYLE